MNIDEITVEAENETSEGRDVGTEVVDRNSNVNLWPRLEELFAFSALSSDKLQRLLMLQFIIDNVLHL